MRYRLYFRNDHGEESVEEVEARGGLYKVKDDHGRVVFGEPDEKPQAPTPVVFGKEPRHY